MDLSYDDVLKILKIIDESEYSELRLETDDLKLHVRRRGVATSITQFESQESAYAEAAEGERSKGEVEHATSLKPYADENSPETTEENKEPIVEAAELDGLVEVRAPMLGTFYRGPSTGADPFVEVGDQVSADDTVCLIEVMKLFNTIPAGVSGWVSEILTEDGAVVEQEQPLLRIETTGE